MVKLISCPVNPLWDHATGITTPLLIVLLMIFLVIPGIGFSVIKRAKDQPLPKNQTLIMGFHPGSPDQISDIFKTKS